MIRPGMEYVLAGIDPVSIHGVTYWDVEIAEPGSAGEGGSRLRGRLGPEAVEGDPARGDRVRVDGFLQTILRIARV